MSTASTAQIPPSTPEIEEIHVSWEEFQSDYMEREDGYEYEWLDGIVERSPYSMDKLQLFILRNLQELFFKLKFEKKLTGQFIAEADLFFGKHHRRPDVCWLTDRQIDRLAEGMYEVPDFVIEVISKTDAIARVHDKMQDYRKSGVKVVWHIFPKHEEVHIYTGEELNNMSIRKGDKICSAAPVLENFELKAEQIFEKKEITD
ncbi:MAG: Uma2 family endonuclease [Bacteroidota bacterium]